MPITRYLTIGQLCEAAELALDLGITISKAAALVLIAASTRLEVVRG